MSVKGVVSVIFMIVFLICGGGIDVYAKGIKSTKPKPRVKMGTIRAAVVIKKTSPPVQFKSISMSEHRPVIQIVKQQRVLTFSFYEYKALE